MCLADFHGMLKQNCLQLLYWSMDFLNFVSMFLLTNVDEENFKDFLSSHLSAAKLFDKYVPAVLHIQVPITAPHETIFGVSDSSFLSQLFRKACSNSD